MAAAISSETGLDASDCYLDNPAPKVSEKVVRCVRHWLEEGLTNRSLIYHQNVRYYRGDRIFNPFLRQNGIVKSVSERTMVVNWEKAGSLMMEHNAQSRYV